MQAPGIGMVEGIELVSWVDNPQFQIAAGLSMTVRDCGEEKDGVAKECNVVSTELKKMHLADNGEYVATMNRVLRSKIDTLNNLQQCRAVLNQWPKCYANEKLISQEDTGFIDDKKDKPTVTVANLKEHINGHTLQHMSEDATDYVKYFYEPCIKALTADFDGLEGGTCMVKSWFSIEECKNVVCTVQGVTVTKDGECNIGAPDVASAMSTEYCMPVMER